MNIGDIPRSNGLQPLKTPLKDISHITIETNQTCNMKCRVCYNLNQDTIKSLEEIRNEIDLALTKRNLETITIIGGEPTLHPDLPEVIKYIKGKGLVCQLLTNGLRFRNDTDLIGKYKAAGLNRVLLHVDAGQEYQSQNRDDIIESHFKHLQENRIYFALSMTIYEENAGIIPRIMKNYAKYSFFDGVLATIERETRVVFFQSFRGVEKDALRDEYNIISSQLCVEPTAYVPSSNGDNEISWLIYFYYINSQTGISVGASRQINHVFRKLYRIVRGKVFFAAVIPPWFYRFNILISLLMEIIFNPLKIKELGKLVRSSGSLKLLRYHYIVIQDGPYYDNAKNALRLCYHCPDATIRNGRITPVCVADLINPIRKNMPLEKEAQWVYDAVYSHLGELN